MLWFTFVVGALIGSQPSGGTAGEWVEVKSPHFVVVSDASESDAWFTANDFERIRAVFLDALPRERTEPSRPIVIFALENETRFRELLPELGETLPVGIFRESEDRYRIAVRLDVPRGVRFRTIYHEYHHLLFRLNVRRAPSWVTEGLAEFWSQAVIRRDTVELGNPNPRHLRTLRLGRRIPLRQLIGVSGLRHDADPQALAAFYAQSWALTHWILLGEGSGSGEQRLESYLESLEKREDGVEAFESAFGSLAEVEEKLGRYQNQAMFPAMRKEAPEEPTERFETRSLSAAEAATVTGSFLVAGALPENALPYLETALSLDPRSSLALESMGYLSLRTGDTEDAERWLDKAIESGSNSFLPYYYKAMLAAERGNDDALEENLLRAIERNEKFAIAHVMLSSLYADQPERQEWAYTLAKKAVELEPAAVWAWVNLGEVVLKLDRPGEAREALEAARALPASDEHARALRKLATEIELHDSRH